MRRFHQRLASGLRRQCVGEVACDGLNGQRAQQEAGVFGSGCDRQLALADPHRNPRGRYAEQLRGLFDRHQAREVGGHRDYLRPLNYAPDTACHGTSSYKMQLKWSFVIDLPRRRDQSLIGRLGKTTDGWEAKTERQKAERSSADRRNRDFETQTHSPASARTGPDDRTASWARPRPRHNAARDPLTAVATINRDNELSQTFKDIGERRWRLWLEGKPVRIAPDLADTLGRLRAVTSEIKTLSDLETKIPVSLWRPAKLPRGHPLRTIFHGL